jgi:hypothetical protein
MRSERNQASIVSLHVRRWDRPSGLDRRRRGAGTEVSAWASPSAVRVEAGTPVDAEQQREQSFEHVRFRYQPSGSIIEPDRRPKISAKRCLSISASVRIDAETFVGAQKHVQNPDQHVVLRSSMCSRARAD